MQRAFGWARVEETGAPAANASVTIYDTGTLNKSTIYSDNLSTPKANPFLADQFGYWNFYAANSRYDALFSGGGIVTPYTLADIVMNDVFTLNGLSVTPQTLATGTAGTDFAIVSAISTHTFNIPDAGAAARGLVTTGAQTFAGVKTFSTPIAITSGGTGLGTAPSADGQLLIGAAGGTYTLGTLTGTANQIVVTNGAGAVITLSTPQSINVGASPTFVGLTLSGLTANRIMVTGGAGALGVTSAATNGQLLIGSTGAAPVWASLTAGANITLTPGPGTLQIAGTGGISSLNGLSGTSQTFAVSSAGADFAIASAGTTHTFKLPDAGVSSRGLVTAGNQSFAGQKTFDRPPTFAPQASAAITVTAQGILAISAQPVPNTVGSVETDLFTTTLGAGPLSITNSIIRMTVVGTCANNANAKTLKVYGGATSVTFTIAAAGVRPWKIEVLYLQQNPGGPVCNMIVTYIQGPFTFESISAAVPAITAGVLKVTGTAAGAADITGFGGVVEWLGN